MKTISHDEKSGSVLGPQGSLERLFNTEEMERDLESMERVLFPLEKVILRENKTSSVKGTGRKCVVCGGAIIEQQWLDLTVLSLIGPNLHGGHRESMCYCQNCEILYK